MKKRLQLVVVIIITALITYLFTTFYYFGLPVTGNVTGDIPKNQKFLKILALIKSYYYQPNQVTDQKLLEGAIRGLTLATEDPYTEYYNKKEFQDFLIQSKGTYYGIGVTIEPGEHFIEVITPFEGSPADKAGIKPGDKIIKINGKTMTSKDIDRAVSIMRGQKGTPVTVTILRDGVDNPFDLKIIRDEIKIKTVSYKIVDKNIGYIRISNFDENTPQDFQSALTNLKGEGIKGLIVDLRFNPGGLLDSVVAVSSNFLKNNQLIVYLKDRFGNRQDYKSNFAGDTNLPLVVLTNGYSASASEIFAGCMKDLKRATLIGEKTFGKGIVQEVFDLKDGSALKMTVSQYFTPNGNYIHKKGIQPDIVVKPLNEYKEKINVPLDKDIQLQKAIEVLKEKF
ncbi:S41 family peptidase [Caldicellulosiruptoraceae bacterium PP1]